MSAFDCSLILEEALARAEVFALFAAKDLADKIRAALDAEFFGQHAQAGVGSDEVHSVNAGITLDRDQQLPQKH